MRRRVVALGVLSSSEKPTKTSSASRVAQQKTKAQQRRGKQHGASQLGVVMTSRRSEEGDRDDLVRICEELRRDFDGTSLVLVSEFASNGDPVIMVDLVTEICSLGGSDDDNPEWLPQDLVNRVETELLPQIVTLLLSSSAETRCVARVNAFFQFVLQITANWLLQGEPCLLPTLTRILDEHMPFYLYDGCTQSDDDALSFKYVTVKQSNSSPHFYRNLELWGQLNGFSLFLINLRGESSQEKEGECRSLPFEAVRSIFRVLYAVKEHLAGPFFSQYIVPLARATQSYVQAMPNDEFQPLGREALVEIVQVVEILSLRVNDWCEQNLAKSRCDVDVPETEDDNDSSDSELNRSPVDDNDNAAEQNVEILRLECFYRFFQSTSLEKRIHGLTELVSTIVRLYNDRLALMPSTSVPPENHPLLYLVAWLQQKCVVEDLFGDKLHVELIKRATPLFQFLSEMDCLTPSWVDLVCNCYDGSISVVVGSEHKPQQRRHDAQRAAAHDLLTDLVLFLDGSLLEYVFRRLKASKIVDNNHVMLLTAIGSRGQGTETIVGSLREQVLMHLWTTVAPNVTSDEMFELVLQSMDEIFRRVADAAELQHDSDNSLSTTGRVLLVEEFVSLCLENVRHRVSVVHSLKLFTQLVRLIMEIKIPLLYICTGMIDAFLEEMSDYKSDNWMKRAGASCRSDVLPMEWLDLSKDQQLEYSVSIPPKHLIDTKVRLLALRAAWILECRESFPISTSQMDQVWQFVIVQAWSVEEISLGFQWIEYCATTPFPFLENESTSVKMGPTLMMPDLMEYVLTAKFQSLPGNRITASSLSCFHSLFRCVNLMRGGLESFAVPSENKPSPASSVSSSSSVQENTEVDQVIDLATGEELVGIKELWHLALHCADSLVAEECMTLLASFHLELIPSLRSTDTPFRRKLVYIETCMEFLHASKRIAGIEMSHDHNRENIAALNRCVDLLRYFLDACDADDNLGTFEEDAVCDGEASKNSADDTDHNSSKMGMKNKFLKFENLEERLQFLEIFPSPIKPPQTICVGSPVPSSSECMASRRPSLTFRQQRPILDSIRDETEEEYEVVDDNDYDDMQIQREFDIMRGNKSLLIHTEEKYIQEESTILGSPKNTLILKPVTPIKSRVKTLPVRMRPNLELTDGVSPHRPSLSLELIDEVLNDVSSSLNKQENQTVSFTEKSKYNLMSHILANEGAHFEFLLELVDWTDETTSQRTWELICRLPINNKLLRRMIRLRPPLSDSQGSEGGGSLDVRWMDLLDTSNVHRLLYALRLVEVLLLPSHQDIDHEFESNSARRQWRERFVRLGGAAHLYSTLLHWKPTFSDSEQSGTTYAQKLSATCLAAVLRTLNYFLRLYQTNKVSISLQKLSAFDTRLFRSTLPEFHTLICHGALLRAAAQHTCEHCNSYCQQSDDMKPFSSEKEELMLASVRTFCIIAATDSSTIVTAFPSCDDPEPNKCNLLRWLQTLLLDCPCAQTRAKIVEAIMSAVATSTDSRVGEIITQLAQAICKILVDTTQPEKYIVGDDYSIFGQLFDFLHSLLDRLRLLSDSSRKDITEWLLKTDTCKQLLESLRTHGHHLRHDTHSSHTNVFLSGLLRTLTVFSALDEGLRETILLYQPSPDFSPMTIRGQWTLDFLLKECLYGEMPSDPNEETATTDTEPLFQGNECREQTQNLLLCLLFSSSSSLSELTAIAYVAKFHSINQASVLDTLNKSGRPWNYQPQEVLKEAKDGIHYSGLVNPGCICYMNALVQQLFMLPSFHQGLLSLDCNFENESSGSWAEEISQLQKLFVKLAYSKSRAIDPTAFALSHSDLDGQATDLRVQMDADEFFCLLLDRLDTHTQSQAKNSETTPHFMNKCFGGVLVNQIITQQGHISEREENFFALSVEVSKKQHLTESLALYVQGETLDGENAYFCERLQQKVSATKRICIKTLPQTLVCHLKRFEFDFDTMEKMKINDYLEFPMELDMRPYTSKALSDTCTHGMSDSENDESEETLYDLVGVVVHSGSSDMGHYYSFIKDRNHEKRWLEFNDETVRIFSEDTMGDECFGGEEIGQKWDATTKSCVPKVHMKRRNAYMLIYDRRTPAVVITNKDKNAVAYTSEVQAFIQIIQTENMLFQRVVNTFDPQYESMIEGLVAHTLSRVDPEPSPQSPNQIDRQSTRDTEKRSITYQVCVIGTQYLFGICSLRRANPNLNSSTYSSGQQKILSMIIRWLDRAGSTETQVSADSEIERIAFCSWLLEEAITPPSPVLTNSSSESSLAQSRRTWLFDLLFLNEQNPKLVQGCFELFNASIKLLSAQAATLNHERDDISDASNAERVVSGFYRTLLELFYDREDIELIDMATSSAVSMTQESTISAMLHIAIFLRSCICEAPTPAIRIWTHQLLLHKVQFLDRFLFALQVDRAESARPLSIHPESYTTNCATSSRSCTLIIERQMLQTLLCGSVTCSHDKESDTCCQEITAGAMSSLDLNLVLNPVALKNMLRFHFDHVLTAAAQRVLSVGSAYQRENLLSLLIAVLEDVKTAHLEQLLGVFRSLLDKEEADYDGPETDISNKTLYFSDCPIHAHLFSATRGILEAAAYYKGHRVLHEYTFLLLAFTVRRADESRLLRQLLRYDSDLQAQGEWVRDWLVQYLDPTGRLLHGDADQHSDDDTMDDDDLRMTQEVKALLRAVNRAFFDTESQLDAKEKQEEFEACVDTVLTDEPGSTNQEDESAISLDDIVTQITDTKISAAASMLESRDSPTKSGCPEIGDDDNEPYHLLIDHKSADTRRREQAQAQLRLNLGANLTEA